MLKFYNKVTLDFFDTMDYDTALMYFGNAELFDILSGASKTYFVKT